MKLKILALTLSAAALLWAGGLYLEVGNPSANSEAKAMNAVLVARVTACHQPELSAVTASLVEVQGTELRRTELTVVPLKSAGMYAVIGIVPKGGLIDLAVTNPEFKDYRPRVLVRSGAEGIQWAGMKRFYNTPPTSLDFKTFLEKSE